MQKYGHLRHGATCRTLGNRHYDFQSDFCVGFNLFVEANAPFLDLPPLHHVPFIGS
jgi:hypothetical protein